MVELLYDLSGTGSVHKTQRYRVEGGSRPEQVKFVDDEELLNVSLWDY